MRVLAILLMAGACGGAQRPAEPVEHIPTETLEHSDPGADTSKHPVLTRSVAHVDDGSAPWSCMRPAESNASPPHFSMGCGACFSSAAGAPGALAPGFALLFALRRRRRRPFV